MTNPAAISPSALRSQIEVWEAAQRDIARQASELKAQSATYEKLIAQATKTLELLMLIGGEEKESADPSKESPEERVPDAKPVQTGGGSKRLKRAKNGTWENEVVSIASNFPDGVGYPELKGRLSEFLKQKLKTSDKAFHSALMKMDKKGVIIRRNEHVFIPRHHARFEEEVRSGVKKDVVPLRMATASHAPVETAVLSILRTASGPMKGAEIVREVIKVPEVGQAAKKNNTGVYNVLTRLIKQGRVEKDESEKTYRIASDEAEETGSGNDQPASNPVAGGGQRSLLNGNGAPSGHHSAH